MTTNLTTNPTLLDFKSRLDPNDQIARVIEILAQKNEILDDITFVEGNLLTGHRTTTRTGLPTPTWRKLYGGVQPTKSTTVQITDTCGMLEAYAEVDKALADLNGNAAAWRLSEEIPFLEGFNQQLTSTLFYGNEGTQPEAFTGFSPRFNSLSAQNSPNIISGSGDGSDNASIWLVVWGPNTVHMIYPKGSKAGMQRTDKGQVTVEDVDGNNGGRAEMYRTHYRWDAGLCVRDWRYIVRIANLDSDDLTKDAASGADLIDLMTQALEAVWDLNGGTPAFYCNRTIRSFLRRQVVNKVKNSTLQMEEVAGRRVLTFDGVPVRRVDQLTKTETAVS